MFRKRLKTGLPSIKDLREKEALSRRIERALTTGESELLTQMLGNGSEEAKSFQAQVSFANVVSHCGCGCPTVGLEVSRDAPAGHAAGRVIVDLQGTTPDGNAVGVLVFADGGYLSELEIYDYEDIPRPFALPTLESLHGFDERSAA